MSDLPFSLAQQRAINLFTYVREFIQSRIKVVRSIDSYEDYFAFSEIPKFNGCKSIIWSPLTENQNPNEGWIEIRKPKRVDPPKLSENLNLWSDLTSVKDSSGVPRLLESIIVDSEADKDDTSKTLYLHDHPEIKLEFENYLQQKWNVWAENDKKENALQEVYKRLFSIYQKSSKFGEAYELLIGFSLLKLRDGSQEIKRHLLTVPASIIFEQETGRIKVEAPAEGVKLSLEQDMLEVSDRPLPSDLSAIERMIKDAEDNIWDGISLHQIGRSYLNAMASGEGQYFEDLDHSAYSVSDKPRAFYSPYLIIRKRTEKNLLKIYDTLIEKTNHESVPSGIEAIVGVRPEQGDTTEKDLNRKPLDDSDIYFPLASNKDQKSIAEKLETHSAVLVQGPPGTGKSHTIANLVCHLLAKGQRVLVTSHTTRALSVLKKKIPKEVSALCVELLGSDQNSMKSLEESVSGILSKYNLWNSDVSVSRSKDLKESLKQKRSEYASILLDLRRLREKDVYKHENIFGEYSGTIESIVKQIKKDEINYSWFRDVIRESSEVNVYSLKEYANLYNATKDISADFKNINIEDDVLNGMSIFENLFIEEENLKSAIGNKTLRRANINVAALTDEGVNVLLNEIKTLEELLKDFSIDSEHWHSKIYNEILIGKNKIWTQRLGEVRLLVGKIERNLPELPRKVIGLENANLRTIKNCVDNLRAHIFSGQSKGFWFLKPAIIKESEILLKNVYVDDVECVSHYELTLESLKKHIDTELLLEEFSQVWEEKIDLESKRLLVKIPLIMDMAKQLETLLALQRYVQGVERKLEIPSSCDSILSIKELVSDLFLLSQKHSLYKIEKTIQKFISKVNEAEKQNFGLIKNLMLKLKNAIESRNLIEIRKAYQEMGDAVQKSRKLEVLEELSNLIKNQFPQLINDFKETSDNLAWEQRFLSIPKAIALRNTQEWIAKQNGQDNYKNLETQQEQIRKEILSITANLASELAWQECLNNKNRFGEAQREALVAWKLSVERIGRGTGRHANRHRKDARKHMEDCRSAIPAWIMPINKVAEVIDVSQGAFDVVIIDEASQSGPEAIFLQYIAKKIVVVGDDKQISPDNIGVDKDGLYSIHQRYLSDIPKSDIISPDNSFFNIAEVRFGGRIRLREHFRCMPEIIQFSNNICYSDEPLIPLKQYGVSRLSPSVVSVYVPGGFLRDEKDINDLECELIVEKISQIVSDPAYSNKTIGVVALQGEWQAKQIEKLLLDRIGAEEIEKREIVCGNAYAFQGDERDIIFLSLVTSVREDKRIAAFTKIQDRRRFNVAASRAKEQMFLYHSVTLNDLNPDCMRYKILEYCQSPKIDQTEIDGISIEAIKKASKNTGRSIISAPDPFDSWFEVDVFLQIKSKGFRVTPQYEVNGRRIDLVVEGMSGRLAVECDGDRWHGPDQYDRDMARQRDLERCGWVFFRIRGSEYYNLGHEKALCSLWQMLSDLGISPNEVLSQVEVSKTDKVVDNKLTDIKRDDVVKNVVVAEIEKVDQIVDQTENPTSEADYEWIGSVNDKNIKDHLEKINLMVVDKRSSRGSLWVLDNGNISDLMYMLKSSGYNFIYTEKGSRATGYKPSWYLKSDHQDKRNKVDSTNAVEVLGQRYKYQFYLSGRDVYIRSVDLKGAHSEWLVEAKSGVANISVSPFDLEYSLLKDSDEE